MNLAQPAVLIPVVMAVLSLMTGRFSSAASKDLGNGFTDHGVCTPLPVGAGGDWLEGRIYFASGSHMVSWAVARKTGP